MTTFYWPFTFFDELTFTAFSCISGVRSMKLGESEAIEDWRLKKWEEKKKRRIRALLVFWMEIFDVLVSCLLTSYERKYFFEALWNLRCGNDFDNANILRSMWEEWAVQSCFTKKQIYSLLTTTTTANSASQILFATTVHH